MKKHLSFHSLSLPLTPFLFLLLFAACSSKSDIVIDEQRTFANDVWNRVTPEVFEVDIVDEGDYFHIDLTVAVDTALYRYKEFPFNLDIYTPDGTHRHLTPQFDVKNHDRWKGEADGRYRVVTKRVQNYFYFNTPGKHRIEVQQATSQYNLEGIHAFKLHIEKAELDIDKLKEN
jgi:gliding motility-associated lipoprotein GldH